MAGDEEPRGRILTEGGPVDRHHKRAVAALVGAVVGLAIAMVVLFAIAITASHDAHQAALAVKSSRVESVRRTCQEGNERHRTAKTGIEALALKITPVNPGVAAIRRQRATLEAFVNAVAPQYDCAKRVKELTSPRAVSTAPRPPFVCEKRVPAEGSECIRQELEYEKDIPTKEHRQKTLTTLLPLAAFGAPGIDISVYQGVPNFFQARLAGLRFAIVQTNDGSFPNRLFSAQAAALRAAGVPFGTYAFLEGFSGAAQARLSVAIARGHGATLGGYADAEVPGAYPQACSFVEEERALGLKLYGVYGSPGTYRGGRCPGIAWPAEWGSGRAYPLPGYPASAVKLRQNCGTCHFSGVSGEVDRDEDLGLMALAASPKPTHAQIVARWHRELDAHYRLRAELHGDIDRHHCRLTPPTLGHAKPPSYHTVCAYWLARGKRQREVIAAFHRKGIA